MPVRSRHERQEPEKLGRRQSTTVSAVSSLCPVYFSSPATWTRHTEPTRKQNRTVMNGVTHRRTKDFKMEGLHEGGS